MLSMRFPVTSRRSVAGSFCLSSSCCCGDVPPVEDREIENYPRLIRNKDALVTEGFQFPDQFGNAM